MHVRHVLGPRLDLRLLHSETSTSSSPVLTVDNSNDRPTEAGPEFLSRLDRMASRSLCTLRSQRHRWATQHSVPADLLGLAGQVHLLLGHFTRFQLFFMRPPRPSSSGATEQEIHNPGHWYRAQGCERGVRISLVRFHAPVTGHPAVSRARLDQQRHAPAGPRARARYGAPPVPAGSRSPSRAIGSSVFSPRS